MEPLSEDQVNALLLLMDRGIITEDQLKTVVTIAYNGNI